MVNQWFNQWFIMINHHFPGLLQWIPFSPPISGENHRISSNGLLGSRGSKPPLAKTWPRTLLVACGKIIIIIIIYILEDPKKNIG